MTSAVPIKSDSLEQSEAVFEENREHSSSKRFTVWKFDMLTAINSDERLKDGTKVFAYFLLDHVNRQLGFAWPSMHRLAAQMSCCTRTAKRHAKDLERAGWILRERLNKRQSNRYYFYDDHILEATEAMEERIEIANEVGKEHRLANQKIANFSRPTIKIPSPTADFEGTAVSPHNGIEGTVVSRHDGTNEVIYEGTELAPEHIDLEPLMELLKKGL